MPLATSLGQFEILQLKRTACPQHTGAQHELLNEKETVGEGIIYPAGVVRLLKLRMRPGLIKIHTGVVTDHGPDQIGSICSRHCHQQSNVSQDSN